MADFSKGGSDDQSPEEAARAFELVMLSISNEPAMSSFKGEYAKLLGALRTSFTDNKKLVSKVKELNEEIVSNSARVQQALRLSEEDGNTIDELRKQLERSWGLVEATNARAEAANQAVERLTAEVAALSADNARYTSLLGPNETIEDVVAARDVVQARLDSSNASLSSERARADGLLSELGVRTKKYREKKDEVKGLQEVVSTKDEELSKAARARTALQTDMAGLKEQMGERAAAGEALKLSAAAAEAARVKAAHALEAANLRTAGVLSELSASKASSQKFQDEAKGLAEKMAQATEERASLKKELALAKEEVHAESTKAAKAAAKLDAAVRDLDAVKTQRAAAQDALSELRAELSGLNKEVVSERHAIKEKEMMIARMDKEKALEVKKSADASQRVSEAQLEAASFRTEVSSMEAERKKLSFELRAARLAIQSFEVERVKTRAESEALRKEVSNKDEAVSLRALQLKEMEKRETELETRLKAAQSTYESTRAERNHAMKELAKLEEEMAEARRKTKVTGHQMEMIKDEMHAKDKQIIAEQFEVSALTKRLEQRTAEVESTRRLLSEAADNATRAHAEVAQYAAAVRRADADALVQKRSFDGLVAERDALATALTRKNDEMALLHEKNGILTVTLTKGEQAFKDVTEEARAMRQKIAELKRELHIASLSNTGAGADLKRQLVSLTRDLNSEQTKVRALSSELENPLNVHRWRKLEGSDPELLDVLSRYASLQKRLITKTEEVVERDLTIVERDRVVADLKARLAAVPGSELLDQLAAAQHLLSERSRQLKSLASEANMFQTQAAEARYEAERLARELEAAKRVSFDLKRRAPSSTKERAPSSSADVVGLEVKGSAR